MSAISGYISTIQNAVYGEQVRTAIVNALLACYSDVENPDLQSAAFQTAIENAYENGILDITTVTSFNDMTNQNIIYRYNGTAAGKQKGLYYYSALSNSWVLIGSEIQKVSLLSQMTDVNDIYKYIGTESGMVQNSLYCHNGTAWTPIGAGILTASTAAQMTNQNAIYKYTGSESGYTTNALYYYNGTAWAPVGGNDGTAEEVARLCYALFSKAVFTENVTQDMLALQAIFTASIVSISATFTQGDTVVTEATELDTLKNNLVVTATDEDGVTSTLSADDYTLTGTLIIGTSTITVHYGDKTDTFDVTVVQGGQPYTIVDTISYRANNTYKTTEYLPAVLALNYNATANTTEFSGKTITEMQFPSNQANATVSIGKWSLASTSRPTATDVTAYTLDASAKIVFPTPISVGANETLLVGAATDTLGLPFATTNKQLNPAWQNSKAITRDADLLFCGKIVGKDS